MTKSKQDKGNEMLNKAYDRGDLYYIARFTQWCDRNNVEYTDWWLKDKANIHKVRHIIQYGKTYLANVMKGRNR